MVVTISNRHVEANGAKAVKRLNVVKAGAPGKAPRSETIAMSPGNLSWKEDGQQTFMQRRQQELKRLLQTSRRHHCVKPVKRVRFAPGTREARQEPATGLDLLFKVVMQNEANAHEAQIKKQANKATKKCKGEGCSCCMHIRAPPKPTKQVAYKKKDESDRENEEWHTYFRALVDYKLKFGDFKVATDYHGNVGTGLGAWVAAQARDLAMFKRGFRIAKEKVTRLKTLTHIGFDVEDHFIDDLLGVDDDSREAFDGWDSYFLRFLVNDPVRTNSGKGGPQFEAQRIQWLERQRKVFEQLNASSRPRDIYDTVQMQFRFNLLKLYGYDLGSLDKGAQAKGGAY